MEFNLCSNSLFSRWFLFQCWLKYLWKLLTCRKHEVTVHHGAHSHRPSVPAVDPILNRLQQGSVCQRRQQMPDTGTSPAPPSAFQCAGNSPETASWKDTHNRHFMLSSVSVKRLAWSTTHISADLQPLYRQRIPRAYLYGHAFWFFLIETFSSQGLCVSEMLPLTFNLSGSLSLKQRARGWCLILSIASCLYSELKDA